jgi:hypothetical protein
MESIIGVFIPIVAIVMGIGLAMIEVITKHRRRAQALEQRHRERMAAIEKGIELPLDDSDPEAQVEAAKAARQPRFLLRGLIFSGIGAALILAWRGAGDEYTSGAGWIVLSIGLAYLVYFAIEGRRQDKPALPPQA